MTNPGLEERSKWPEGNDQPSGLQAVPGFEEGGRVERTGIALVHEGEYILPAPGSEAAISAEGGSDGGGPVVNYHFPIEVEIVGALSERQLKDVANYIYAELRAEFDARGLR